MVTALNELGDHPAYRRHITSCEDLAHYLGCVENGQTFGDLAGDRGVGTFGGSEDHTAILCSEPGRLRLYRYAPARFERAVPAAQVGSLERGLVREMGSFLAADLAVRSGVAIADELRQQATEFNLDLAETAEFSSMVYRDDEMHLASIKAVGEGYPLRGWAGERVEAALWQGFGALKLAASQVGSGSEASSVAAAGAAESGPETVVRIIADLEQSVE